METDPAKDQLTFYVPCAGLRGGTKNHTLSSSMSPYKPHRGVPPAPGCLPRSKGGGKEGGGGGGEEGGEEGGGEEGGGRRGEEEGGE